MQTSVNEMNLWISEEIAFARQGLEDDIRKAVQQAIETQMVQCVEMQSWQDDLSSKVERLQSSVQENVVAMQRFKQSVGRRVGDEIGLTESRTSRKVADERRWRMRFKPVEATLDQHMESIELLSKQLTTLSSRIADHEVDIRENAQTIQRVDAQLKVSGEKGRFDARTQSVAIDALRRHCDGIEARISECDVQQAVRNIETRLSVGEAERRALQAGLDKCSEALNTISTDPADVEWIMDITTSLSDDDDGDDDNDLVETTAAQAVDLKSSNEQIEKFKTHVSEAVATSDDEHNEKLISQYICMHM
jgi:hypothetical protein